MNDLWSLCYMQYLQLLLMNEYILTNSPDNPIIYHQYMYKQ